MNNKESNDKEYIIRTLPIPSQSRGGKWKALADQMKVAAAKEANGDLIGDCVCELTKGEALSLASAIKADDNFGALSRKNKDTGTYTVWKIEA